METTGLEQQVADGLRGDLSTIAPMVNVSVEALAAEIGSEPGGITHGTWSA